MALNDPVVVHTAESNLKAHLLVDMLCSNGIEAFASEDQSGVSLFAFGRISQFHQPQVWVDRPTAESAVALILHFEEKQRQRTIAEPDTEQIEVLCEDCGNTTLFAAAFLGTIQDCPNCEALIDVGEPEEFEVDDEPEQA